MKKSYFVLLLAAAMMMVGCAKNHAEQFQGTYNMTVIATSTVEMPTGQQFPMTDTVSGNLTIALDGDEGNVKLSGIINATGSVDKEDVMHLDPSSFDVTYDLPFGFGVDAHLTLQHGDATLNAGNLQWTATAGESYTDDFTFSDTKISFKGEALLAE